jgi:DNA replication protein DnaC
LRWLNAAESVVLYGPVGVRVHSDLAGGRADRTWGRRIREYTKPLVLILDDFAMREHTAMHADDLYELISDRAVNGRPLI